MLSLCPINTPIYFVIIIPVNTHRSSPIRVIGNNNNNIMFTVPNSTSPRSGLNAIIAMANTYLAQIADKVDRIDE